MPKTDISPTYRQLPLNPLEILVARKLKTGEVSARVTPFLEKSERHSVTVPALDRIRRKASREIVKASPGGIWIIRPEGKEGRFYLWNLAFRPIPEGFRYLDL